MDSVGVFREGEIDGKPFHIFTIISQTAVDSDEAAIDSDGVDDLSPPLFLCPSLRLLAEQLKLKKPIYSRENILPFSRFPHFPNKRRSVDQQVQYLLESDDYKDICKLPVVPLFSSDNTYPNDVEFYYGACLSSNLVTEYYLCPTCGKLFHKECVESPHEIKHPSYPFFPLHLYNPPGYIYDPLICTCCETTIYNMFYHCPTYKLNMHPICAMKPIPLVIDHPKRHSHPLTFFPKQAFLPCNVCGFVKNLIPTYICFRCIFVVHEDCIFFPRVIKISRHEHGISFTSSLPSGSWCCGVCRQKVEIHYGAYSCNKCDDYFVHSRCALRRDLWDNKKIEGVPEEPYDEEPFEMIAAEIILHFSHDHHLKLKMSYVYDKENFCQACVLPIYEGSFYSCMDQCDFNLHESCANASLKIDHGLHRHPLTLKVVTTEYDNKGHFCCDACQRESCGFVYECSKGDCEFQLDVRCASVSEPFKYEGHPHPLFLGLKPEENSLRRCQICQIDVDENKFWRILNCIECDYAVCFKCATLPFKARYEDDTHMLTFFEGKEAGDHSDWCDVCERKITESTKEGFYRCKDCCNTLHVNCLLGEDPYMIAGETIIYHDMELHILRNDIVFRPLCHSCEQHCPHRVVFKATNEVFCSLSCVSKFRG